MSSATASSTALNPTTFPGPFPTLARAGGFVPRACGRFVRSSGTLGLALGQPGRETHHDQSWLSRGAHSSVWTPGPRAEIGEAYSQSRRLEPKNSTVKA